MNIKLLLISSILFLFNISACKPSVKFDRQKWTYKSKTEFLYRDEMLSDLVRNQLRTGLQYSQLTQLLGKPDDVNLDEHRVFYEIPIKQEVGPIHGKHLTIELTIDSTVAEYQIVEWTKGQ